MLSDDELALVALGGELRVRSACRWNTARTRCCGDAPFTMTVVGLRRSQNKTFVKVRFDGWLGWRRNGKLQWLRPSDLEPVCDAVVGTGGDVGHR